MTPTPARYPVVVARTTYHVVHAAGTTAAQARDHIRQGLDHLTLSSDVNPIAERTAVVDDPSFLTAELDISATVQGPRERCPACGRIAPTSTTASILDDLSHRIDCPIRATDWSCRSAADLRATKPPAQAGRPLREVVVFDQQETDVREVLAELGILNATLRAVSGGDDTPYFLYVRLDQVDVNDFSSGLEAQGYRCYVIPGSAGTRREPKPTWRQSVREGLVSLRPERIAAGAQSSSN